MSVSHETPRGTTTLVVSVVRVILAAGRDKRGSTRAATSAQQPRCRDMLRDNRSQREWGAAGTLNRYRRRSQRRQPGPAPTDSGHASPARTALLSPARSRPPWWNGLLGQFGFLCATICPQLFSRPLGS